MMKICVTGNKGFIGRALQVELEKMGAIVLGIDKWIFEREPWRSKYQDYLEKISPDAVFHIGACSNTQNNNIDEVMRLNVESSFIIADYCKKFNIPLIYSSSAAIYGTKGEPESLYAWSKYIAEKYIVASGGVALRYFNVYGCGELHKGTMASIALQAYQKNKWGEEVRIFPKSPTRDFIYIDDVASANITAWDSFDSCRGRYYDVGTGDSRTFEDVLNILEIPFTYTPESDMPQKYQLFTKANSDLFLPGWKAKYDLENGMSLYKSLLKVTTFYPI